MVLSSVGVMTMMVDYKCTKCENTCNKYFRKAKDVLDEIECTMCDEPMERQLGAPNTKSTQFVDNGLQARRVEVSSDIIQQEKDKLYRDD